MKLTANGNNSGTKQLNWDINIKKHHTQIESNNLSFFENGEMKWELINSYVLPNEDKEKCRLKKAIED